MHNTFQGWSQLQKKKLHKVDSNILQQPIETAAHKLKSSAGPPSYETPNPKPQALMGTIKDHISHH